MTVKIHVEYPATDGSMPESVEVEWADEARQGDVMAVLDRLLAVAGERSTHYTTKPPAGLVPVSELGQGAGSRAGEPAPCLSV